MSDQGLEFDNNKVRKYYSAKGIEWEYGSPYHHQTIGAVERANKSLMNILKKMSNFGFTKSENLLKNAIHALNISYNRSIGTSHYILKRHKLLFIGIDKSLDTKVIHRPFEVVSGRREAFLPEYVRKSIIKGTKSRSSDFTAGDRVLGIKTR